MIYKLLNEGATLTEINKCIHNLVANNHYTKRQVIGYLHRWLCRIKHRHNIWVCLKY
jgi:hypothetical protein